MPNFEENRGTKTILGNRDNIRKQIFRYLGNRGTIQFISGEQVPHWEGLIYALISVLYTLL